MQHDTEQMLRHLNAPIIARRARNVNATGHMGDWCKPVCGCIPSSPFTETMRTCYNTLYIGVEQQQQRQSYRWQAIRHNGNGGGQWLR
jgi:hypothetical protein